MEIKRALCSQNLLKISCYAVADCMSLVESCSIANNANRAHRVFSLPALDDGSCKNRGRIARTSLNNSIKEHKECCVIICTRLCVAKKFSERSFRAKRCVKELVHINKSKRVQS